jgi:CheY-like chemotaxis protein
MVPALATLNVLCVEDEPDTRLLMRVVLGKAGFAVVEADDGGTALQRIAEAQPDLIVTDLMMPGIDGKDLIRRLRQDPGTAEIPVVLLTAHPFVEDTGADIVIKKPFRPESLIAAAERLTRKTA